MPLYDIIVIRTTYREGDVMLKKNNIDRGRLNLLIIYVSIALVYIVIKNVIFGIELFDYIVIYPNIVIGLIVLLKLKERYALRFVTLVYFIVFSVEVASAFFESEYFYLELISAFSLGILYFTIISLYSYNRDKWVQLLKLSVIPATVRYLILIFTNPFDGGYGLAELRFLVLLIPIAVFVDDIIIKRREGAQKFNATVYMKYQVLIVIFVTLLSSTMLFNLNDVLYSIVLSLLIPIGYAAIPISWVIYDKKLKSVRLVTCTHLEDLELFLKMSDYKVLEEEVLWSEHTHDSIFFDVILNKDSMIRRFKFKEPVEYYEGTGRIGGKEAEFRCNECKCVIGSHRQEFATGKPIVK